MKHLAQKLKRRFTASTTDDDDLHLNNNNTTTKKTRTNSNHKKIEQNEAHQQSTIIDSDDQMTSNIQYSKEDLLEPVPSFREVPPEKRCALFIRKLRLCSVIFDFQNESTKENLGKEMKRQILLELVDHITTNKGWFSERILTEILSMINLNLFRSLSPSTFEDFGFDPDEDEPSLDLGWPHLQIVYEFLLRFIVSPEADSKLLKRHLNRQFIVSLLNIFQSEDPREREYLKTILHRIYGKFMSLRSTIRRSINDVFYSVIYVNERHNGIGELLEILGSIINGFAMPLKIEHKKFLRNVLIPLHKTERLQVYHQQLSYCITQFIDKDSELSAVIIGGLLKFWPLTSSSKEVLLLNELEEIIEIAPAQILKRFLSAIFGRLALCIANQHFQVAERALFFWNNDLIANLSTEQRAVVFPIIVPVLDEIQSSHWNTTVHSLTLNVTRMMSEIDATLYQQICQQTQQKSKAKLKAKQNQNQTQITNNVNDNNSNSVSSIQKDVKQLTL